MEDNRYILGLDIGTNSIGWALLRAETRGERLAPTGIERTGVRIFEAGVAGSIQQGRTTSHAKDRRDARMMRRNIFRDGQRLRRAFRLLQQAGLLPGDPRKPCDRDRIIKSLDAELRDRWEKRLHAEGKSSDEIKVAVHHNLPYLLRARGLDERLEPFEVGRALYQLSQRRGFKSTRKNLKGADEGEKDQNSIEKEAGELKQKMVESGSRTLGEFFSRYNPFDNQNEHQIERIRGHHTVRLMYRDEFEKLWEEQARHYPHMLTAEFKKELLTEEFGVFWQRQLKSQEHLIGKCELEPRKKRCPMALLEAQRFRFLQKLNDTRILAEGREERLSQEQYEKLVRILDEESYLRFKEAKAILGLKKGSRFNLEAGGEKSFIGNKSAAKFVEIIGDVWRNATPEQRSRMVLDYWRTKDDAKPMERTSQELGLDEKTAEKLTKLKLEQGYCAYSLNALRRLLPDMEQGICLYEARVNAYGEPKKPEPLELLPPVNQDSDIRNPVVQRSLTELRKVVNAIVREYGKPDMVRVELAREMKKSDKDRKEIWKKNEEQRKRREQAAKEIFAELGRENPPRSDIEKVLLWHECGGPNAVCPYTGKSIASITELLSPRFDVEHIIPFSLCLDDSFMNKTLCEATYNRQVKKNKIPSQLAGFEEMKARIDRWPKSETKHKKLERFNTEEVEDLADFTNSQLNDTRYASRLACDYLGKLYGGKVDTSGKLRVQVGKGMVTHHVRNLWQLNRILNDGPRKNRDDHRHHAVDAIAIAITDAGLMKRMSDTAARAKERGERWYKQKPDFPWQSLLLDATRAIKEETIVSHRASHKVNTGFHQGTIYSKQKMDECGKSCVHIRRTLGHNLNRPELESIVDPRVREAVHAKIRELGYAADKISDADWKKVEKAFSDPANLPCFIAADGRRIPIKKVRVRKSETVMLIGKNGKERNVSPGSNSHIEVFEVMDSKGRIKWDGWTVTSYEAMQRLKRKPKEPVVNRVGKDGSWKFKFSLSGGDVIELTTGEGRPDLFVIKVITVARVGGREYARIKYAPINAAKQVKEESSLLNPLRTDFNCRKVTITPLGAVHEAND